MNIQPNPKYEMSKNESEPFFWPLRPRRLELGTMGSQNHQLVGFEYQVNILRVNRQINKEARPIFDENSWIQVSVNKKGYTDQLIDHCFGVVSRKLPSSQLRLKVSVIFRDLNPEEEEEECFTMSSYGFTQLPRAIWTTAKEDVELYFNPHPSLRQTRFSDFANIVLKPFCQIPGIGHVYIPESVHNRLKTEWPVETNAPPTTLKYALLVTDCMIETGNESLGVGAWEKAAAISEEGLAFLSDCAKMLSHLCFRQGRGFLDLCKMACELATNLANARNHLGEHLSALKYTNYVLGLRTFSGPDVARVLLQRGLAFAGLEQDRKAARDFWDASELAPQNKTIMHELYVLMNRLDPDPEKAFDAFWTLRRTIEAEKNDEKMALRMDLDFRSTGC